MKRLIILFCLILGMARPSFASHDGSGILIGAAIATYSPTAIAAINLVDGFENKGTWIWSLSGIAAGALQMVGGGFALADTDEETKKVLGPLLAAGAINVGAGIFAVLNRRPPAISVTPMVGTEQGMIPGLSLGFTFK